MPKLLKNIQKFSLPLLLLSLIIVVPAVAFAQEITFVHKFLWGFVNTVFGTAVGLSGLLLNFAVTDYVVGFGKFYQSTGLGDAINNLWSIIRDVFNLTFIFGLVFIGFKMIFNSDDSGAKKMLVTLVIAALLVNFSLFITKFVIDFSNIAAAQIAAAFSGTGAGLGGTTYAISDAFMTLMGLNGLLGFGGDLEKIAGPAGGFTYIFGTMFLYITAAFVFAAGGLLLMIRFVTLNFYMVLSPLMFLGFVFPGLSGVSRDYWKGFMSKAFFAPAYLLMLYIANQVLVGMKGASGVAGFKEFFSDDKSMLAQFGAVIPYFIMTIGFLIGSIIVAQKMGAEGANTAVALGRRASNKTRQYTTNAITYAPRRAGREVANRTGEATQRGLRNLQGGTGWKSSLARTNLVTRNVGGAAAAAAGARFGTGTSNQERRKENRDLRARTEASGNRTRNINQAQELAALKKKKVAGTITAEEQLRLDALIPNEVTINDAIASMSTSDMEEMGTEERNNIGNLFTAAQVTEFNKSAKASDSDKASLNTARQAEILSKITDTNGALISDELNKLSINQLETLGAQWIDSNSHLISDSQMKSVKDSKKFTDTQRNTFAANRKTNLTTMATSVRGTARDSQFKLVMKGKSPKDIAKLPAEVLSSSEALPYISANVLREIATEGTLTPDQQRDLKTSIITAQQHGIAVDASAASYFSTPHATNNWAS